VLDSTHGIYLILDGGKIKSRVIAHHRLDSYFKSWIRVLVPHPTHREGSSAQTFVVFDLLQ